MGANPGIIRVAGPQPRPKELGVSRKPAKRLSEFLEQGEIDEALLRENYVEFSAEEVLDLGASAMVAFGDGRPELWFEIGRFYRHLDKRSSTWDRCDMVLAVWGLVMKGSTPASAMWPVVDFDPDPHVVALATEELAASDAGFVGKTRRALLDIFDEGSSAARCGILAGLLNLGSRRINKDLVRRRRLLGYEEIRELRYVQPTCVHASTIDFFLDWLEEIDSGPWDEFGILAGLLAKMPNGCSATGTIIELPAGHLRTAPDWNDPGIRHWSFREYGRQIMPRLEAIAARESEPKVMDCVIELWKGASDDATPTAFPAHLLALQETDLPKLDEPRMKEHLAPLLRRHGYNDWPVD